MLLARYFLYVGGALLALLLVVSAELPQGGVVPVASGAGDLPTIRISSDRKWPAKVVLDTESAPVVPTQIAGNVSTAPSAAPQIAAATSALPREAFAQLAPADLKKSNVKKLEPKLHQTRKVAKRRVSPPPMMVAQQPQYGFFGNRIW